MKINKNYLNENYVVFNYTPEDIDLDKLLKKYHTVDGFIHQISADDPENKTYYTHQFCLCSQSYANWLRGYWESNLYESFNEGHLNE